MNRRTEPVEFDQSLGVLRVRNVEEALVRGLDVLQAHGQIETSRAGDVYVLPCPVVTVYARPMERVLLNPVRDANPFFHLMESIWMLAGWRDAHWLDTYVSDFSSRFAEENGDAHGAYGHRWRRHFDMEAGGDGCDQLTEAVFLLSQDKSSRRVVISMWDPVSDLGFQKKDLPCNTHIYLRVRDKVLDLTVCCRSNDIVWGAYGANAVHFSVLQEYLAARLGVGVGKMIQVSNNWHGYTDILHKLVSRGVHGARRWDYTEHEDARLCHVPMFTDAFSADEDIMKFMALQATPRDAPSVYKNQFFARTAEVMRYVHQRYKQGDITDALAWCHKIEAPDWRLACREWLERRAKGKKSTEEVRSV